MMKKKKKTTTTTTTTTTTHHHHNPPPQTARRPTVGALFLPAFCPQTSPFFRPFSPPLLLPPARFAAGVVQFCRRIMPDVDFRILKIFEDLEPKSHPHTSHNQKFSEILSRSLNTRWSRPSPCPTGSKHPHEACIIVLHISYPYSHQLTSRMIKEHQGSSSTLIKDHDFIV